MIGQVSVGDEQVDGGGDDKGQKRVNNCEEAGSGSLSLSDRTKAER